MHAARRLWLLSLVAIALAGGELAITAAPATGAAEAEQGDGAADLHRRYPLGERRLCCTRRDLVARGSSPGRAASRPVQPPSERADMPWLPLGLAGGAALLAIVAGARRFSFRHGYLVRLRPRRRWPVGPRGYRFAQSLGYRYSAQHDALVPAIRGGHFGPVLKLRPTEQARIREDVSAGGLRTSQPPRGGSRPAAPTPPANDPVERPVRTHCTLDIAFLPLPHAPRNAGLWQLTAVDLGTRFAWADVVRRRNGPTAKQVATFVERIARELEESDRVLGTLIVHEPPAGLFERGLLPAGVRLLTPEHSAAPPEVAADAHQQIADTDTTPLAAGSLAHLRGRLHNRVAAYNAEHGAPARRPFPRTLERERAAPRDRPHS